MEKQIVGISRGNFQEKIYYAKTVPKSVSREINRITYEPSKTWCSFIDSHSAYNTDFCAFQYIESWFPKLTLKNDKLISEELPRKTPLIFSCKIANNHQKLFGPLNLHLGSIDYKIIDFETNESISFEKTFVHKSCPKSLPHLFNSQDNHNGAFLEDVLISTQDNFSGKNLLELKIEDKKIITKILFQTKWASFENSYTEVLNSGEDKYPIRNFSRKSWLKFINTESFLKYNNKIINIPKSTPIISYVDESYGFPPTKTNWDWLIFKSNDTFWKKDVRLIIGKKCLRSGYEKTEKEKIVNLFVSGKIYRLKGTVTFEYDINNLSSPWEIHFVDPAQPKKYNIKITTNYIAPKIEKSLIHSGFGPVNVSLDLQRIIAKTNVQITLNGKKIQAEGIGSFESNKGIKRGTRYFND